MRALVVDDAKLLRLVTEWALTRTHRLEAKRAMDACGLCEHEESGDFESSDPGVARCYRLWSHVSDEWCLPCRNRQPLFDEMRRRKRVERDVFRRLCAFVGRNVKATQTNAVDPIAGHGHGLTPRDTESS